ncbi:MAG: hypothetical protein HQ523_04410 [Lentisphaerae bacterium]|nr:hypothetical protein [Lentisphaerota bacterium]
MPRNHNQSMGYWINEPILKDPERIDRDMAALAEAGYGIVRVFLRKSNYHHRSPEFVRAVARVVEAAHARGLRVALDCEPRGGGFCHDLGQAYPDAVGRQLLPAAARVVDGVWRLRAAPHSAWTFEGVEAAFLKRDGTVARIELEFQADREGHFRARDGLHRELVSREGVALGGENLFTLCGTLPGVADGELVVYLRFITRGQPDFWADGLRRYYDELLECYRDIPLDGVGWDEPGCGSDWKAYRYGIAFAAAFERLNGYALADKLYLLDAPGMSAEATRVRLDYYRTLGEGLAQAQANLIAKARELFGNDLLLGTHHTWQGEGGINDYRDGAMDYFRLNDNMDAGYTDCSWWDPPSVAYAYALATSLARLSPSGEAEVNSWHFKPTVDNSRVNVNRMTLMNITWFNIWYGGDYDCILQQGHYTWPETVRLMQRHRDLQRHIGKKRPVVEVAVWHGWEGVCAWNQPGLANVQKSFCINTSQLFLERGIAMDFLDSRLLAASRVEGGRLVNDLGRYRVLIVPYALVLPREAFDACAAFARAGGRVVFVGTPVARDERGESLAEDFARLLDVPAMTAERYMEGLEAICDLPNYRPQRLEVCRPLPADWPRVLVSCEGERHGVASPDGNAVFLSDLDPGQRLVERIEDAVSPEVEAYGENLLWRLYRGDGGDLLVVVAREDRPLGGIVRWRKHGIELTGGSAGLFSMEEGSLAVRGDVLWTQVPRR